MKSNKVFIALAKDPFAAVYELNADFSLNCIFRKVYFWRTYPLMFTHIRFNKDQQTIQIVKAFEKVDVFKLFEIQASSSTS